MYEHLGGDAIIAKYFKDAFNSFNFFENTTHSFIIAAPFLLYSQLGSKMFDNIHHAPVNYLVYMGSYVIDSLSKKCFLAKNSELSESPDMRHDSDLAEEKLDVEANSEVFCVSAADVPRSRAFLSNTRFPPLHRRRSVTVNAEDQDEEKIPDNDGQNLGSDIEMGSQIAARQNEQRENLEKDSEEAAPVQNPFWQYIGGVSYSYLDAVNKSLYSWLSPTDDKEQDDELCV